MIDTFSTLISRILHVEVSLISKRLNLELMSLSQQKMTRFCLVFSHEAIDSEASMKRADRGELFQTSSSQDVEMKRAELFLSQQKVTRFCLVFSHEAIDFEASMRRADRNELFQASNSQDVEIERTESWKESIDQIRLFSCFDLRVSLLRYRSVVSMLSFLHHRQFLC